MRPEQRAASRLRDRLGLKPPIDIESVVRQFADLERDDLPANCDAVVLRTGRSRPRPLILLDERKPPRRRRFTLAHELGHLTIPWHLGTVACHTDGYVILGEGLYGVTEAEANRFASEFLLPAAWLADIVSSAVSLKEMLGAVRVADLSPLATAFALTQVLPPGFLFLMVDGTGAISRHGASEGTTVNCPRTGRFEAGELNRIAVDHHRAVSGGDEFHWYQFATTSDLPPVVAGVDSSTILRDLLANVHAEAEDRTRASQIINGVIGAANSTNADSSAEELYTILIQKFVARASVVSDCVKHSDFRLFLAMKAQEIVEKRG